MDIFLVLFVLWVVKGSFAHSSLLKLSAFQKLFFAFGLILSFDVISRSTFFSYGAYSLYTPWSNLHF